MTRKDYELLATVIKQAQSLSAPQDRLPIIRLMHDLCAELKQDNPNFDKARFVEACGLPMQGQA